MEEKKEKNGKMGKCALCGSEGKLTFEHIPPRKAFNWMPARPITSEKLVHDKERLPWDIKGIPYSNQQQGMGKFSLCPACNNNTGTWYGNEYVEFAKGCHSLIKDKDDFSKEMVSIEDFYPLRLIKQVVSMFCSINPLNFELLHDLREFVLDKNATGLDKSKYKICVYFTKSLVMKYVPFMAVFKNTNGGTKKYLVSEITAYPLGFLLYYQPEPDLQHEGIDITGFADCDYDAKYTTSFPMIVKDVNDVFPTFYRTREEIVKYVERNKVSNKYKE